jgi:protein-tyrosine-phosphatase
MKIAFVCKENACRSQIAEALAGKMWSRSDVEFVSAGTHSAQAVAPLAIEVLREEGILWQGSPKSFDRIGQPDVLVTMGCDVVCPHIPGVRTVEWEIPDPRGKAIAEFRRVMKIIREHLLELEDF